MSPRNRHLRGTPSSHDTTHPRDKGDIRRPLGAPRPVVPNSPTPGPRNPFGRLAAFVILLLLAAVAAAAVYVTVLERQEPAPPSNQPTGATVPTALGFAAGFAAGIAS